MTETREGKKTPEAPKENPGTRLLYELIAVMDRASGENPEAEVMLENEFSSTNKKLKEWGNKIANVFAQALHEKEKRKRKKPAIMTREEEESLSKKPTLKDAAEELCLSWGISPQLSIKADRLPGEGAVEEKIESAVIGTSFLQGLGFLGEGVTLGSLYESLPAPEKKERFNVELEHELRWGGRPTKISENRIVGLESSELPGVAAEVNVVSGRFLYVDLSFDMESLAKIAEGYLAGEI